MSRDFSCNNKIKNKSPDWLMTLLIISFSKRNQPGDFLCVGERGSRGQSNE